MSLYSLITRGFGSWGSIGDIIRRGLSAAPVTTSASKQSKLKYYDGSNWILLNLDYQITSSTVSYSITDTDGIEVLLVTTGATDKTITLPTAADNTGRMIRLKKTDSGAGNLIVDGEGAETVDGSANVTLYYQHESVCIISDGTEWWII